MKKILLLSFTLLILGSSISQTQVLINNFMEGIAIGDPIESVTYTDKNATMVSNAWHLVDFDGLRKDGTSPLAVAPLSYGNYVESGKSNAFEMLMLPGTANSTSRITGFSLTDKGTYKTGAYYLAFMVNVSSSMWTNHANAKGFIMFNGSHTSAFRRVVCYVNKINATKLNFGLLEADADYSNDDSQVIFSEKELAFETTHLLVLKYDFSTRRADLFVNPPIQETEPESDVFINNVLEDFNTAGIRAITVRQRRNNSQKIGGLRFSDTWKGVMGLEYLTNSTKPISDKRVVSEEFYTITGVRVYDTLPSGYYIKKLVFDDNSTATEKVLIVKQ